MNKEILKHTKTAQILMNEAKRTGNAKIALQLVDLLYDEMLLLALEKRLLAE